MATLVSLMSKAPPILRVVRSTSLPLVLDVMLIWIGLNLNLFSVVILFRYLLTVR